MVYFEFWVELVLVWKEIPVKMAQNWPFLLQPDTPTPRHRSAHLGVELRPRRRSLRLGEPEPKFAELSGPPRRSEASPRCTC